MKTRHSKKTQDRTIPANEFEKKFPPEFSGYCWNNAENDSLSIVITSDLPDADCRTCVGKLTQYLLCEWGIYATAGISNTYDSLSDLWKAYIEATTALDHRLVYGKGSIIFFSEVAKVSRNYALYSPKSMNQLITYVENGDYALAELMIDGMSTCAIVTVYKITGSKTDNKNE